MLLTAYYMCRAMQYLSCTQANGDACTYYALIGPWQMS
jgi:hypothetical protein